MDDVKIFRSTLFWIISIFFTIILVLTILNLFFGIGKLNSEFQSKLFYAFLVEIAAAVFALFYALFGLKKGNEKETIAPNKLSDIVPAKTDVSEKEIQTATEANNDIYVGPDRSFQINQPPASWKIVETNYADLIIEMRGIKNEAIINEIKSKSKVKSDVVLFDSGHTFWIQPKPGQSIINESSILTALDITATNSLLIIPSERYTAPTYLYTSGEKLLLQYMEQMQVLTMFDVKRISSGVIKSGNRKITEIEAIQTLQNVIVNQSDFTYIELHHHFFSVEGEKKNYIIQLSFLKNSGNQPEKFDADQKILFDLLNSFKPLRANNIQKETEIEKTNIANLQNEFNQYAGEQIFLSEAGLLFSRITDETFDNSTELKRILKTLRQFQNFSKLIKLDEGIAADLNVLWTALDKAEQGQISDLKAEIKRILKDMNAASIKEPPNKEALLAT